MQTYVTKKCLIAIQMKGQVGFWLINSIKLTVLRWWILTFPGCLQRNLMSTLRMTEKSSLTMLSAGRQK